MSYLLFHSWPSGATQEANPKPVSLKRPKPAQSHLSKSLRQLRGPSSNTASAQKCQICWHAAREATDLVSFNPLPKGMPANSIAGKPRRPAPKLPTLMLKNLGPRKLALFSGRVEQQRPVSVLKGCSKTCVHSESTRPVVEECPRNASQHETNTQTT